MGYMRGWRAMLAVAALVGAGAAAPPGAVGPKLTVVHQFKDDFHLVGIGVSKTGRVFATSPSAGAGHSVSMLEVDPVSGKETPYPDAAWNTVRQADDKPQWARLQALYDDKDDHLWALDTGLPTPGDVIPAKLVEFDLSTNKPIHSYTFEGTLDGKDALNDVNIDTVHHAAYLTNAGPRGGLAVVDLNSGKTRLVLAGDRSTVVDSAARVMVGDQPALKPDGSPFVAEADGIAMSADAQYLYYRPLNDHNYWRIPTAALRDASLSETALAAKVQFLGTGVVSGGLVMDRRGTLYAGDIEHATVVAMRLHHGRFASRVFVRAPGQMSWADGFAISRGELYISDSHLNEVAFKNSLPRSGPFTIFKVKLPD
jgi:sugar lactone lactonase YvrE